MLSSACRRRGAPCPRRSSPAAGRSAAPTRPRRRSPAQPAGSRTDSYARAGIPRVRRHVVARAAGQQQRDRAERDRPANAGEGGRTSGALGAGLYGRIPCFTNFFRSSFSSVHSMMPGAKVRQLRRHLVIDDLVAPDLLDDGGEVAGHDVVGGDLLARALRLIGIDVAGALVLVLLGDRPGGRWCPGRRTCPCWRAAIWILSARRAACRCARWCCSSSCPRRPSAGPGSAAKTGESASDRTIFLAISCRSFSLNWSESISIAFGSSYVAAGEGARGAARAAEQAGERDTTRYGAAWVHGS